MNLLTQARKALRPTLLAGLVAALTLPLGATAGQASGAAAPKPTIVIEHGAFADASGFATTIASLQKAGYPVYAPANPLRGLSIDTAYLKSFLATVSGPIVLVGHSYGGAVITDAATGNPNVKALVYLAAYALADGENAATAATLGGGSNTLLQHLVYRPYPGGPQQDADASIDPAYFRQIFAQDVPATQAAVLAATQRPVTVSALTEPSTTPAWQSIPSWYLVALDDHAIPPVAEQAMAARADAYTIRVHSSHAVMVSHPDTVTRLILTAAAATSR
jgi:pimeloyl-ACP methyl ester carboxylesterase